MSFIFCGDGVKRCTLFQHIGWTVRMIFGTLWQLNNSITGFITGFVPVLSKCIYGLMDELWVDSSGQQRPSSICTSVFVKRKLLTPYLWKGVPERDRLGEGQLWLSTTENRSSMQNCQEHGRTFLIRSHFLWRTSNIFINTKDLWRSAWFVIVTQVVSGEKPKVSFCSYCRVN